MVMAVLGVLPTAASVKTFTPSLLARLRTIDRTASDVAAGHDGSGPHLRKAARKIALTWQRVAPVLTAGGYIVEATMTNRAMVDFERNWNSSTDPRSLANEITGPMAGSAAYLSGGKPTIS
jgi:hypothetical protein